MADDDTVTRDETPRRWLRLDALFPSEGRIATLRLRFGPPGPWTFIVLLCDATARYQLGGKAGITELTWGELEVRSGVGKAPLQRILKGCQEQGLLADLEDHGDWFSASFPKWDQWNPRDRTAAERQARYRAKKKDTVTQRDVTRDVTACHIDKSREEENNRPDVIHLCNTLASLVQDNDPKAQPAPESHRWRNAARLLIDRDNRTPDEAEAVIRWALTDPFWKANILSMPKLREKYTTLLMQSQRGNPHAGTDTEWKERLG